MPRALDVLSSTLATGFSFVTGIRAAHVGARPEKLLELYEFEACPFCRKAREALTIFDLDARIFPCPRGGTRFRPVVKERGGKAMFPYLFDPNTGASMYESDAIVRYLAERYGDGTIPTPLALGPLTTLRAGLASAVRPHKGRAAIASRPPEKPLELWSFEASPFCRIAREALCSLELTYVLHNVPKGGRGREAFVERSGKMMVPYLVDPNTGHQMFESADIVKYLMKTYAA